MSGRSAAAGLPTVRLHERVVVRVPDELDVALHLARHDRGRSLPDASDERRQLHLGGGHLYYLLDMTTQAMPV